MAKTFTKKQLQFLPKYVKFSEDDLSSTMRLYNPEYKRFLGWRDNVAEYYRDAGCWSVDIRIDKKTNKIYSVCEFKDLHCLK